MLSLQLGGRTNFFLFGLSWSTWAWSLGAPWKVEHNLFLFGLQFSALKVGGWIRKSCAWPFIKSLSTKFRNSMKGWTKKISSASHGVPEQVVQGIHEKLSSKNALNLQLLALKVGGWVHFFCTRSIFNTSKNGWVQIFLPQPLLELGTSKTCQTQIVLCSTSDFWCQKWEVERNFFCFSLVTDLSSTKLKSSKTCQTYFFYAWPPTFSTKSWR